MVLMAALGIGFQLMLLLLERRVLGQCFLIQNAFRRRKTSATMMDSILRMFLSAQTQMDVGVRNLLVSIFKINLILEQLTRLVRSRNKDHNRLDKYTEIKMAAYLNGSNLMPSLQEREVLDQSLLVQSVSER